MPDMQETTDHLLQDRRVHEVMRSQIWTKEKPMARKTFNMFREAGMSILDSEREEECLVHCKILIFWIRMNDTFRKKTLGLQCSLKKSGCHHH